MNFVKIFTFLLGKALKFDKFIIIIVFGNISAFFDIRAEFRFWCLSIVKLMNDGGLENE